MIVEEIITNLEDKKIKDTITLNYHERFIRRKKLVSDNNFEFLVNLPETISVNKDEGFLLENDQIILIKYAKETLIEIKSDDLIKLAWHIVISHIQFHIENDRLLIQDDKVIEKIIIIGDNQNYSLNY